MDASPPSASERQAALDCLTDWLAPLVEENPAVAAVVEDVESDADRWFVRVNGDAKDVFSVWFTVDQRTLTYETYVLPFPEENQAAFFEQLLRRNNRLRELAFCIGDEDAIFLRGQIDIRLVDAEVLDRILGSTYAAIEDSFTSALRLGFASRFAARES